MSFLTTDTIFALSTPPGRSGLAVIRISGPGAGEALGIFEVTKPLTPRYATLVTLREKGERIDECIALWFPGPHSFSGEDTLELQLHGSRAILSETMRILASHPGFRLAETGEFTRRAIYHGRMDLTQAEALVDIIDAETTSQLRLANRQLQGQLLTTCRALREGIVDILAYTEALLDFSDEELPEDMESYIANQLDALIASLDDILSDNRAGERLREGVYAVILGLPNAGKSSLLNLLAARDIAIVSEEEGTTRDILEAHLDIDGYPLILADTAGIRSAQNRVESEGIRRALERAEQADFRVILLDASRPLSEQSDIITQIRPDDVVILNKMDIEPQHLVETEIALPALSLSLTNTPDVTSLVDALRSRLSNIFSEHHAPVITRERHRQSFTESLSHLTRAKEESSLELKGESMRLAARSIGKITGEVGIEEILDRLFSSFCIGK